MGKPTYNPGRIVRKRRHGFRARTAAGGRVLRARRSKGRARLSAQCFPLRSKNIIRKHEDFVRASVSGIFVRTDFFILQVRENSEVVRSRVGITVSKRVGNAVVRNRCKRRLRVLSEALIDKDICVDYVFIARRGLESARWDSLMSSVRSAVRGALSRLK